MPEKRYYSISSQVKTYWLSKYLFGYTYHNTQKTPNRQPGHPKIRNSRLTYMIRKIAGRASCVCRGTSAHEVTYDVDGATLIEKYCDNCIKSVFAREEVL